MTTETRPHLPVPRRDIYPDMPSMGVFGWDRLPVVADTSMLLNDCLDAARGQGGSLLLSAARSPIAHIYATERVRTEVERRLPGRAETGYVDPLRAQTVWRQRYLRLIRFVEIDGSPRGLAAIRLRDRHPNDLPTALLAELLAPCLVFSYDNDLVDTGIARRDWMALTHDAEEAAQLQILFSGGAGTILLGGAVGVEVVKSVIAAARAALVPTLLLGAIASLLGYRYWTSERALRQRAELKSMPHDASGRLSEVSVQASKAKSFVQTGAFVLELEPTDLAHVARAVGVAAFPPRPSDLATRLGISTQKVTSLLRKPIFSRTGDGRYLLGTSYAPPDVS